MTKRCEGLSLVEVMLALTIIAIGLTVLIASASKCVAVAAKARIYEDARHLLAIVELENPIDREEFEAGSDSGTFDYPYNKYGWQRIITEAETEEEEGLYTLTTRITWSRRGRQNFEEVVTYIFAPESVEGDSL